MGKLRLEGSWIVRVPRRGVYDIITDFEKLPVYFPAVAKSAKIVSRDGNRFVVEAETKAFFGSKTYKVRMEGELRPPDGFVSTNTSEICVEEESFMMDEVPEGTRIRYLNVVDIKNWFYRIFGFVLIKYVALWYWKRIVIDKFEQIYAEHGRPDGKIIRKP